MRRRWTRWFRFNIVTVAAPDPLVFVPFSPPAGLRASGNYSSFSVQATGGNAPITYAVTAGSLPPGMTLMSTGLIAAGTLPSTAQGSYAATITASSAGVSSITDTLNISVDYATLSFNSVTAPSAVQGSAYAGLSAALTPTGGQAPRTLVVRSGTYLPPGLSLTETSGTWNVTGTCTGGGGQTYAAILDGASTDGQTISIPLSVYVQPVESQTPFRVTYPVFPVAVVGSAYATVSPTVSGGSMPITSWVHYIGDLPSGMTFNTSTGAFEVAGTITGTYGTSYSGVVYAEDSSTPPQSSGRPYSITVEAAPAPTLTIVPPAFSAATPGAAYSQQAITGGEETGTVTWTVTGALPGNVSFSDGLWTAGPGGVSLASANQSFAGTYTATDSGAAGAVTASWSITVAGLSSAFVAPSQIAALPSPTIEGGSSTSETVYNTATYISPGSATDVVISADVVSALPAGVSVVINDPSPTGTFSIKWDVPPGVNPVNPVDGDYRLTATYTDQAQQGLFISSASHAAGVLTVTGQGFGTRSATPLVYDNFSSGINGGVIAGQAPTLRGIGGAWTWGAFASYYHPRYSTAVVRGAGTRSSYHQFAAPNGGSTGLVIDYPRYNDGDETYFSFWRYHDKTSAGWSNNIKPFDVFGSAGITPAMYIGWGEGNTGGGKLRNAIQDSGIGVSTIWDNANIAHVSSIDKRWQRIEGYFKQSAANTANGVFDIHIHQDTPRIDRLVSDLATVTRTGAAYWQEWMFGFYNCVDERSPDSTANVYLSEIYFDNTRARVELGNAPTWAGCTRREVQPSTAWSATSITAMLNRGLLSGTVYAYVVDATGAVNENGYPVTL